MSSVLHSLCREPSFCTQCKSLWARVTRGLPVSVPAGLSMAPLHLRPQTDVGITGTQISLCPGRITESYAWRNLRDTRSSLLHKGVKTQQVTYLSYGHPDIEMIKNKSYKSSKSDLSVHEATYFSIWSSELWIEPGHSPRVVHAMVAQQGHRHPWPMGVPGALSPCAAEPLPRQRIWQTCFGASA